MTPTKAAISALAAYRLTKLVLEDEITRDFREKIQNFLDKRPGKVSEKALYLLSCPWCVGFWAAVSLEILRKTAPKTHDFTSNVLASSAITGILYENM